LCRYAPADVAAAAREWAGADVVASRRTPEGILASVLRQLADGGFIRNTTDGKHRLIVRLGETAPADTTIDPWFHFEARLALRVAATLSPPDARDLAGAVGGADRELLEVA
jgi:hypothetical protein